MKIEIAEEADRSQMIFDWIVAHLRLQGRKSAKFVEYKDVCIYRYVLTDGTILKCAIGCLISDEHYRPDFENKSFGFHVEVTQAVERSMDIKISGRDVCLILNMQSIHDNVKIMDWEAQFKKMSSVFDVDYRPVVIH